MSEAEPLTQELENAIAKVRHQIEVQASSAHYIGSEQISAEAIGELQAELIQLQDALARVKGN